ncbi:MAG: linear amide C-N hydrolase [Bythopirellula sp.]
MKRSTKMKSLVSGLCVVLMVVSSIQANACSFFFFKHNGKTFVGRTNELPFETDETLIVVPRGYTFHGVEIQHGFVGINHGSDPFVSSGLNEFGLQVEGLGLGESKFAPNDSGGLSMLKLPVLVLGNAKSVDEAVELIKKTKIEMDNMTQFGDIPVGFHWAITDSEKSVVVEYTKGDGTPDIYENEFGVMTNDPLYPEQVRMAKEMVENAPDPKDIEGSFIGFDRTPEGRFQQIFATNLLNDLSRTRSDFDAVNHTWSMVNSLEVCQGTLYWRFLSDEPQMTAYSVVVDIANRDYYLRTYDNMNVRKVDLDSIDFETTDFKRQPIYRMANSYSEVDFN